MDHMRPSPGTLTWWKRENLIPGLALLVLTGVAWAYTLSELGAMFGLSMTTGATMRGMDMPAGMPMERPAQGMMDQARSTGLLFQLGKVLLFLAGWTVMMVAMMLPAALPLVLLYRTIARKQLRASEATTGLIVLLAGYFTVWTAAGLPVYAYNLLASGNSHLLNVVPGILLIAGGFYQFTALKHGCHTRCSNPLFFLMNRWRPGAAGAARLGILHGIDCVGCCLGLMAALVAFGMMNLAWMLTAAVIIFAEKTLPGGHRIARPLGLALIAGGGVVLAASFIGSGMTM